MTRHVYEVLAETVHREEAGTCFALLGDANMNFAAALQDLGTPFVHVRHEHCAVSAAMSHARATGDVGLASVTCGPGVTQLMTALPAAVRAGIPLVILAGEAPLSAGWYNQGIDQGPFVKATGASYRHVHHVGRMPTAIRDAFLEARNKKCPVVVGLPFDLQAQDWLEGELPEPSRDLVPQFAPIPPHPDAIARAATLAGEAGRVVVMAGRGAVTAGAGAACRALAERLGGLLATSLPARGLFHDERFSLGIAGGFSTAAARAAFEQADLVIAVGCRLAQHNTDKGKFFPKAEVLQIDAQPLAVSQGRVVARHHLRADARLGTEALAEAVPRRPEGRYWRSEAIARRLEETPADPAEFPTRRDGLLDPRDVVAALDAALPKDWEMVNSSGHCSYYFAQMTGRPVEHFHTIREFGAIGNGTSYAMGVAAARAPNKVVLFDGDGSLLMHVQELETMRRHGMDILICAMNDGAYGSEIHKLRAEGLSEAGAVFGRPDLGAIARGFGAAGEIVSDLSTLPELVEGYDRSGGVTVWDFHVSDRIASPVVRRSHPGAHEAVERPVDVEDMV